MGPLIKLSGVPYLRMDRERGERQQRKLMRSGQRSRSSRKVGVPKDGVFPMEEIIKVSKVVDQSNEMRPEESLLELLIQQVTVSGELQWKPDYNDNGKIGSK